MLAFASLGLFACGDDPPGDVEGNYSLTITNGANGCMTDNWTEGESSSGTPFVVTRTDASTVGVVEGLAGVFLQSYVGTNRFQGATAGTRMNLLAIGTTPYSIPGCAFTIDAEVSANVSGEFLSGEIVYTPNTDGSVACGLLNSCENVQTIAGTRPPPGS